MEEQKEPKLKKPMSRKTKILIVILLILIGISLFNVLREKYKSRDWKTEFVCQSYDFYDNQSAVNGNTCPLRDCKRIKTELNTDVDECLCGPKNLTVMRKCIRKSQEWVFLK